MLSSFALLSNKGVIDQARTTQTFQLPLTSHIVHPNASGKTLFAIDVKPTDGSKFTAGRFDLLDASGKALKVTELRIGRSMYAIVNQAPGNYSLKVRGFGASKGAFETSVRLVGDINGDLRVDAADLKAIQTAITGLIKTKATPAKGSLVADADGNGVLNRVDLKLANTNLGTSSSLLSITLKNTTGGKYTDDQIYVTITAKNSNGDFSYLVQDGNSGIYVIKPMQLSDNTVSVPQISDKFANYSITLAQLKATNGVIKIANDLPNTPTDQLVSGKIWISYLKPVLFKINEGTGTDNKPNGKVAGFAPPSFVNPSIPGYSDTFDSLELTLNDKGELYVNTTQVDQFAIQTKLTLESTDSEPTQTAGLTAPRDVLFDGFFAAMKAPFQSGEIESPIRLLNPTVAMALAHDNLYPPGTPQDLIDQSRALSTYFDDYIKDVVSYYSTNPLTLELNRVGNGSQKYVGNFDAQTGQLTLTGPNNDGHGGTGSFVLYSPLQPHPNTPAESASLMVFAGNGVFNDLDARGLPHDMPAGSIVGALEAQLNAAFMRGVLSTATNVLQPTAANPNPIYNVSYYYNTPNPYSAFAKYWHQVAINNKAYAFSFDDVNDQSSTLKSLAPKAVTIEIGVPDPVRAGDAGTADFWASTADKKGQKLIAALGDGVATYLSTTYANLFPSAKIGTTAKTVAAYYLSLYTHRSDADAKTNTGLETQAIAVALSAYATNPSLGGGNSAVTASGFKVSKFSKGLADRTIVPTDAVLNLQVGQSYVVLTLLQNANTTATGGSLLTGATNTAARASALKLFTLINTKGNVS